MADSAHTENRALTRDEAVACALGDVTWDDLAPIVAERLVAGDGEAKKAKWAPLTVYDFSCPCGSAVGETMSSEGHSAHRIPSLHLEPVVGDRKPLWRWLVRVAVALIGAFVVIALLAIAAREILPVAPWPLEVAALLTPWLLLPALPAVLVSLWLRMPLTSLSLGLGSLVFIGMYGPQFAPRLGAPAAEAPTLHVMTYNVASWRTTPDQVIDFVRESGADVVALQETGFQLSRQMAEELKNVYPHHVPGHLLLLSRYPITHAAPLPLLVPDRSHLLATLDVDGRPLRVIIAHPNPPIDVPFVWGKFAYREHPLAAQEADALAGFALNDGPTVVLADLNAADRSASYRRLIDAGLVDGFRASGWGLGTTWPQVPVAGLPGFALVRLDYVLYTPHLVALRAWVEPGAGSDHRAVLAEIGWRSGAGP